jgi:hypothetical protein
VCEAFLESVDETMIALLSREVADALYLHLQTVHSIPRDEIPYKIETLCLTLQKIFGVSGTATICKAIARRLFVKLGLTFPNSPARTLPEYVEEAKVRNREKGIQV